jgi:hypothetical protein
MVKLIRMISHITRVEMGRTDAFASIAVICFESLRTRTLKAFAARFENTL